MCKIISFEKHCYRKQKTKEIKATEHYEYNENIYASLGHMASEESKILDRPGIENLIEREKEDRKKFEERYSDILAAAPISVVSKIQYFAGIMLHLLPSIFHGEWQNRFDAHMDFSEFYLLEFDTVYSQYHNEHQEYEKEYPFRFISLDADALDRELQNCLTQLTSLSPAKSRSEKSEIIMWQACRLFELYHNMNDLILEEFEERKKEGRGSCQVKNNLTNSRKLYKMVLRKVQPQQTVLP